MSLGIVVFAVMFTLPLILSVVAITGETSPRRLLMALMHSSKTEYAADNVPAVRRDRAAARR